MVSEKERGQTISRNINGVADCGRHEDCEQNVMGSTAKEGESPVSEAVGSWQDPE